MTGIEGQQETTAVLQGCNQDRQVFRITCPLYEINSSGFASARRWLALQEGLLGDRGAARSPALDKDVTAVIETAVMNKLSYRSPKTEIKDSPIHGKGLFAKDYIAKDEIVAIKGGSIISRETWAELEKELGAAEIQISDEFFITPVTKEEREGSMLYTNHSCDPNIGIQGQIVFVALRDIVPGEELTHDWATTDDLDYEMECRCGSSHCRGTITGKDWMKTELQEKYKGYFSWYLQRKIEQDVSSKTPEHSE